MTRRPTVKTLVRSIRSDLTEVATEERRVKEKAYLKSDLEHIGATVPQTRKAAFRALQQLPEIAHDGVWELAEALWAHPVHELRAAAVEVLAARTKHLRAGDTARVRELIREARTWALVDPLSISVAGHLVESFATSCQALDSWSTDVSFWVRRASMLALLRPLRAGAGDFDRFSRFADVMLEEREFFIRKAIGWVLREVSKKRPELVTEWIEPRLGRASGVTVREAVKKLPRKDELLDKYRALSKARR